MSTAPVHNLQPASCPCGNLTTIPELSIRDKDMAGVHFHVCNSRMDVNNLIRAFLENLQCDAILNYKGDTAAALPRSEVLHFLGDTLTPLNFYNKFLGLRDKAPRNPQGESLQCRRYAALYIVTSHSFKDLKKAFMDRIGGRAAMQHFGWYLNPYADVETVQKIFAVLLGKNTLHGHAPDYAFFLREHLKRSCGQHYNVTTVTHNESTLNGTRVSVFGF